MDVRVTMTWPILSEDEHGLNLGKPFVSGPIRPIFPPGANVSDFGIVFIGETEYQRLNFGKLD